MPWSVTREGGKWCVTKQGESSPLQCYEARADAIKYQRVLYANESRDSVIAALAHEEPAAKAAPQGVSIPGEESKIDRRLQSAMELISEFTQDPPKPHPIHVTVENDNSGMEALVAALVQITERLQNGERVSESLVASLQTMSQQPAPVVNVEPPVVHVAAPNVNVEASHVTVPAPQVTVNMPEEREKKVTFTRDPFGKIEGAEITEE